MIRQGLALVGLALAWLSAACASPDGAADALPPATSSGPAGGNPSVHAPPDSADPEIGVRDRLTDPDPPLLPSAGAARLIVTLSTPPPSEAALRATADELLAPDREQVRGAVQISPAVRAFRVEFTDSSAAASAARRLRADARVQSVEVDRIAARPQ